MTLIPLTSGACCQIADDRGFNVDFSLHDFRLGSENRGLFPVVQETAV